MAFTIEDALAIATGAVDEDDAIELGKMRTAFGGAFDMAKEAAQMGSPEV
jgi:hypothetical protein